MSRELNVRVPGRGFVRLSGHTIDDSEGRKAIVRRWYVYATQQPFPGEAMTSKEEMASKFHGTVLKGWYRLGLSRWSSYAEAEVAVGGDDSMVQLSLNAVVGSFAIGVGVPRRWLDPWVYNRRTVIGVKVGYCGTPLVVDVMRDEQANDMREFYRERWDDRHVRNGKPFPSERALRGGIHREFGPSFAASHVVDRLWGKKVHTLVEGDPVTIVFQMPGSPTLFEAVVKSEHRTWKRARAWWQEETRSFYVNVDQPPQFAGKGENSWDCGDDGIYGMNVKARTPEAAVQGYIKAVMDETSQRGPASSGARA